MDSLHEVLSSPTSQNTTSIEQIREHYDRALEQHPTSGLLWYSYAQLEFRLNNTQQLEAIFAGALKNVLDLRLWRLYLQHVKRQSRALPDRLEASNVIIKAFEFCLANIGHDVYSGITWLEYVDFVKGTLTGEGDESDKQVRIDQLRRIYQKALSQPLDGIEHIWQSYDHFETMVNRTSAKKMLAERSPAYMHCRSLVKELKDIVDGIDRDWVPVKTTAEDAEKWQDRLVTWMRWIEWEQANGAKLEKPVVNQRVIYAYRRALACCNYIPELWLSLLEYVESGPLNVPADLQPIPLLRQAIQLIPKSLILTFSLITRFDRQQPPDHEQSKALFESLLSQYHGTNGEGGNQESDIHLSEAEKCDLSLAFIQYMQWARRSPGGIAAARAVFTRARKHQFIMYPVFTANALMEFHVRKDQAVAGKIFELGLARFGSQPGYIIDYANWLIGLNDDQNVRALFERAVNSLLGSDKDAAYPIWCMYLDYESRYGEADSFRALEKRFKETFPADSLVATSKRLYSHDASLQVQIFDYKEFPGCAVEPGTLAAKIGRNRAVPFVVGEPLIDLIGRLPLPSKYDGPVLDHNLVLNVISQVRLTGRVPGMSSDHNRRRSISPRRR